MREIKIGKGLGEIKFGISRDELKKILGKANEVDKYSYTNYWSLFDRFSTPQKPLRSSCIEIFWRTKNYKSWPYWKGQSLWPGWTRQSCKMKDAQ